MDLKALANRYTTPDGTMTIWMMPYSSLKASIRISELRRLEPQFVWVYAETGERVTTEPPGYAEAIKQAQAFEIEPPTPWRQEDLWDNRHNAFAVVEPSIVALEVTEAAAPAARALARYWQHRSGATAPDWELFNHVCTIAALDLLYVAYDATRDPSMALPDAQPSGDEASTDPQPASGGPPGSATTSASSTTSRRKSEKPKPAPTSRS